ncbi:fluoride efflux transporter CrcB [Flavobacteriaceae bacterium Ap0902]|nr:fluoride efflux transporter CrcB [Flavobacteriaceae bacterium Ap0902]
MYKNLMLIFIGGGLGSVLRFGLGSLLNKNFPYGTMAANVLGCLFIGLFLGLFEKQIINNSHVLILAVGFCGGFTTFSSFAAENLKMIQNGEMLMFLLYLGLSILLGLFFVFFGFKLAKLA